MDFPPLIIWEPPPDPPERPSSLRAKPVGCLQALCLYILLPLYVMLFLYTC